MISDVKGTGISVNDSERLLLRFQKAVVFLSADELAPHAFEVRCMQLAVYEFVIPALTQINERQFRSISRDAKHTLSAEDPPAFYSIKTANERAGIPYLDRMCNTSLVKIDICLGHVLRDPGAALARASDTGTVAYDCGKVLVPCDLIPAGPNEPAHAVRDMYFIGQDHKSLVRAVPEYGFAFSIPGKDTTLISQHQTAGREVASYGQQTVLIGMSGIGEYKGTIQVKDHCSKNNFISCNPSKSISIRKVLLFDPENNFICQGLDTESCDQVAVFFMCGGLVVRIH